VPIEEKHLINDDYMCITAKTNPTACIGSPLIEKVKKKKNKPTWVYCLPSLICFINVVFHTGFLSKCRLSVVADFLTTRNTT